MSVFTAAILYFMIYWLVLFMVLPWGNKPLENTQMGNAAGAPANPRIIQKFMVTGLLAAIVWGVVVFLIHAQVIDFYAISRQMADEDFGR